MMGTMLLNDESKIWWPLVYCYKSSCHDISLKSFCVVFSNEFLKIYISSLCDENLKKIEYIEDSKNTKFR